jgi:hypothetical protein
MVLSPIACYLSGLVTVYRDTSDSDSPIEFQGFPVWFYKIDPEYSLMDRWQLGRLCINLIVWAIILGAIFWFCSGLLKRRGER